MAWPDKVKETVLVKCGRHCCICHKFCGTKIELHHIVLKSEGGRNTAENCIPLCFDCHADQKSYDFKHPRGTKYSPNELKAHRENWYSLVGQNLGVGTTDHLEQDIALFHEVFKKIPPRPTIVFLQQFDFRRRHFNLEKTRDLSDLLVDLYSQPWINFFDSDIQSCWEEFIQAAHKFEELLNLNTFPNRENHELHEVPREWIESDPERYNTVTSSLNDLGDEIVEKYSNLVSLARAKLGVIVALF